MQSPEQVYSTKITADTTIRKDSLFATGSGSSTALHGNLLTLPLGRSFLYVEPLYTLSTNSNGAFPTLQRIIVVYGNKVGYGATLADALSDFEPGHTTGRTLNLNSSSSGSGAGTPVPGGASTTPTSPSSSGTPSGGSTSGTTQLAQQLKDAATALDNAIAVGDKAAMARALARINELTAQALQGSTSPTAGASSTPGAPRTSGSASP